MNTHTVWSRECGNARIPLTSFKGSMTCDLRKNELADSMWRVKGMSSHATFVYRRYGVRDRALLASDLRTFLTYILSA